MEKELGPSGGPAKTPEEIISPYLDYINTENPQVQWFLWDLNLMPEQITSVETAEAMADFCEWYKTHRKPK